MKIPLLDLKAQYAYLRSEVNAAITDVLDSSHYVLGKDVAAFEEAFADYCGAKHGIAVNSGTSALHLALLALGVGSESKIVTTPHTFVATVAAVGYTGATPVLVDIDAETQTISSRAVEAVVATDNIDAILPVHLYGRPADMDALTGMGLPVIEDAAQAHGSIYRGRKCGGIGAMGCFSFYPSKTLGTYGEGGMIVTSDDALAEMLRCMRDWGQRGKYNHIMPGFNYRMAAIEGAVLRVKLPHLEEWITRRAELAEHYRRCLWDVPGVSLPGDPDGCRQSYYVFAVQVENRDTVRAKLAAAGIATEIHYPIPVHLLPAWQHLGYKRGDFPVAEAAAEKTLSLPLYPEMTTATVEQVADVLDGIMRM